MEIVIKKQRQIKALSRETLKMCFAFQKIAKLLVLIKIINTIKKF